ncbi:hypothetical protein POJ06DRAFT_294203 [Lipomyces tetrasporus]|uniref:G-patch domain-containing protein n=1 Tax=Lipomyces tetrasporus TaxID=54092 RepID=A0AAD7QX47_9ASCO|nr:uncharacterized protein POJ06DRAFT_294203 [Lipomyces tetrasporus]KAJ8102903.1 hypothetical protein POJ06DRAFT_294203 [Lipomyces tetrasporus]
MSRKRPLSTVQSASTNAESVFLGTPIADADANAFTPVWKQEARDERGRKRFHGAFTGGFSAGYFNSVGSSEGWTPSTFKSSRTARADQKVFRPEDFMDEEDLAEQRADERLVAAAPFSTISASSTQSISGTDVQDLLRGGRGGESVGYELLRKMGWKPGFGIGAAKSQMVAGRKVMMPPRADETAMSGIRLTRKLDTHGLGYDSAMPSLRPSDETSGVPGGWRAPGTISKKKNSGIGVGVVNEYEDGDDEDPYEIKPIAYDRVLGSKKQKGLGVGASKHVFVSKNKPKLISASSSSAATSTRASKLRRCHDGRLPLSGFVLVTSGSLATSSMLTGEKEYAPPSVPETYISGILILRDPKTVITAELIANFERSRKSSSSSVLSARSSSATQQQRLTASERSRILGSAQDHLQGKSVFDYMTPAQRERFANVTGNQNLPPAKSEVVPTSSHAEHKSGERNVAALLELIPTLDKSQASTALSAGFMPYADDAEKRSRYITYLESQSGTRRLTDVLAFARSGDSDTAPGKLRLEDWMRELKEFNKAAGLFRPLKGMLGNRFTSSANASTTKTSVVDDDNAVLLQGADLKKGLTDRDDVRAAKMGMYGPLTRRVSAWAPSGLLCKRFGVRVPNVSAIEISGGSVESTAAAREKLELLSHQKLLDIAKDADVSEEVTKRLEDKNISSGGLKIDVEVNEALEQKKAPRDLFLAVFGDSDDDSEKE